MSYRKQSIKLKYAHMLQKYWSVCCDFMHNTLKYSAITSIVNVC